MNAYYLPHHQTPFSGKTATIIGQITHDTGERPQPGGCAYFAARTLQDLGAEISLLTCVGLDFQFEHKLRGMRRIIDVGNQTTVFTNIYPKDGPRIQYVTQQAPAISPNTLPDEWCHTDLLLLAPVMGELNDAAWQQIRGSGHTSMFLQGFLKEATPLARNNRRLVVPRETPFPWEILTHVDSVFLSTEDIELFASSAFLSQLIERVPIVAVTDGENGCRIHYNDTCIDVGVFPVDVCNPTGAGDTFGAAMAMALASGFPVADAGRLGAAAASTVVERNGEERLTKMNFTWERWRHITSRKIQCHHDYAISG